MGHILRGHGKQSEAWRRHARHRARSREASEVKEHELRQVSQSEQEKVDDALVAALESGQLRLTPLEIQLLLNIMDIDRKLGGFLEEVVGGINIDERRRDCAALALKLKQLGRAEVVRLERAQKIQKVEEPPAPEEVSRG